MSIHVYVLNGIRSLQMDGVMHAMNTYRIAEKCRGRNFHHFAWKQAFCSINFMIFVLIFFCFWIEVLCSLWLQAQEQRLRMPHCLEYLTITRLMPDAITYLATWAFHSHENFMYRLRECPEPSSFVLESDVRRADNFLLTLSVACGFTVTRGH